MNTTRPTFRGPRADLADPSADGPTVPWSECPGDEFVDTTREPLAAMVEAYRRLGLSTAGALAWARADYGGFFPASLEA